MNSPLSVGTDVSRYFLLHYMHAINCKTWWLWKFIVVLKFTEASFAQNFCCSVPHTENKIRVHLQNLKCRTSSKMEENKLHLYIQVGVSEKQKPVIIVIGKIMLISTMYYELWSRLIFQFKIKQKHSCCLWLLFLLLLHLFLPFLYVITYNT